MQALAKEISPELAALSNDVYLNDAIFNRVEAIFKQKDSLTLTAEERELLDMFRREGWAGVARLSVERATK